LKPVDDLAKADHPRARMPSTREFMGLPFKAYELGLTPQVFQRREELFSLRDWTAQVLVTMQDQERRVDVLDVGDGRKVTPALGVAPGQVAKLLLQGPSVVTRAEERIRRDHTAHRYGRPKRVGMAHGPIRHEAPVAPACHSQALLVDAAARDGRIQAGHHVLEVLVAPVAYHCPREDTSIPRAAARIRVDDGVAL